MSDSATPTGPLGIARIIRELRVDDPALESDERMLWERKANRAQSPVRAVGGKLYLTNRRLVFATHRFDANRGGKDWSAALTDITAVETAPVKLSHYFGGGVRKRLRVVTGDTEELFVVSKLPEVVELVEQAAAAARGSAAPTD